MSSDQVDSAVPRAAENVAGLVHELRELGAKLEAQAGKLVCRAPKGTIGPEVQTRIASHKAEILAFLESEARSAADSEIERVPREQALPLGFVQQRMWLHSVMEPDTVLYHLPAAWRLTGPLDREALDRAFADLVARHEILRIRIDAGAGEPRQYLDPADRFALAYRDLSDRPAETRDALLQKQLAEDRDLPFELEGGLLMRGRLVRLAAEEHVLFFMPHHVVWDGWSFDIFLRELTELYTARLEGRPARLPEMPLQYVDYAVWHRRWLQGGEIERQWRYWEGHLAGELPVLELPTDRPRPRVFTYGGDWQEFQLDGPFVAALAALGQEHNATFFMVMLAAWYAFLHRHTGQGDIVVGVPIQARERPEVAGLIGPFVNTLVLRARMDRAMPFRRLLEDVRQLCIDGYENQEVPVEMLVDRLVKVRSRDHTPLFQAMFSHQQVSRRPQGFGPLSLGQVHVNPAASPTDIMLAIMEGSEVARGVLHYSTDLFAPETVKAFWERFETLLGGVLENPDATLAELPLLPRLERERMLFVWNAVDADYDHAGRMHDAFARAAAAHPTASAVECGGSRLLYGELDRAANQLAHRLRALGAGPGSIVGLYLERSTDLVVALLGILRSGAAYLPLDPSFPAERLAYMLDDSRAGHVVTSASLAPDMPRFAGVVVPLDGDREALAQEPVTLPEGGARPEDRAYVIYTSGSTGRPKGVEIPHRAVVNFLESMAREPGLAPGDRLLAVTTTSFDISVLEIFLPLSVGGTVVLATQDEATDGEALVERLKSDGITILQATPATWRLMLEAGFQETPQLKALCGGEALPQELAAALLSRVGELWNMYGPTETTVWSTCARVRDAAAITIGRPIANTQLYILDEGLAPVPVGVSGELFIGGDGVTLGYLGQPELTRSRFLADPLSATPGGRMYRTGDRVRYRRDGQVEHLGRIDHQVKVRGYRIELGEIEAVLDEQAGVKESVVVAREFGPGDVRLVAYVVAAEGRAEEARGLRKKVRSLLPEYMIPASFVALASMPRTPNGKVDRKALPAPESMQAEPEAAKAPPRTDLERLHARVWSELLGVAGVGIKDNFFDLGGHSLLALTVAQRIHQETGVRMHPRELIFSTLEQVAAICEERGAAVNANAPASAAEPEDAAGLSGLMRQIRGGSRST